MLRAVSAAAVKCVYYEASRKARADVTSVTKKGSSGQPLRRGAVTRVTVYLVSVAAYFELQRSGSVSAAVRELLLSRPAELYLLQRGVVNISALARSLIPDIERKLGRHVSEGAVKVAIARLATELALSSRKLADAVASVLSKSSLSVVDGIGYVTVRSADAVRALPEVLKIAERARFFQMTQSVGTYTFIADNRSLERLHEVFGEGAVEEDHRGQAALIIVSPREIIDTPGVVAFVTGLLYSRGINITQIVSAHTDTIIIVDKERIVDAYSAVSETIERLKGRLRQ